MTASRAPGRSFEIDALRGLMLVLMTLTHLPTRLTDPLGQPFGFVSAAEGFVLLSAYMVGRVYSRIAARAGLPAMERALRRRAFKVYAIHAAILLFVFSVVTALSLKTGQPAVQNLVSYYLAQPWHGLLWGLLLVYEPALLDILPMYVFFLLISPWLLAGGMRHGFVPLMVVSLVLWLAAQFGLGPWVHGLAEQWLHLPVPYGETGAFNGWAWQFIWVAGLWMGVDRAAPDARPWQFPRWLMALAVALALWGLVWRHWGDHGQAPFGGDEQRNLLFDKWLLGPLRLLDLMALSVVTIRFGPALARALPRQRWLETLGAGSLPAFCTHLVAVLLVLACWGDSQHARPWWGDALLLAAVLGAMWGVAWWLRRRKGRGPHHPAPLPAPRAAG